MRKYIIKRATEDDIDEILAIEQDVFQEELQWDYDTFVDYLYIYEDEVDSGILIAVDMQTNKIAGYLVYVVIRDVSIDNIAVAKNYRNQNIGAMLIHYLEHKYNLNRNLKLETKIENISYYEKLGFEKRGILREFYDDGSDAIIMIKPKKKLKGEI